MGIPTLPMMPLPEDPERRAAVLAAVKRQNERRRALADREPDFSIDGIGWVAIIALALGGFGG
jgi:hypothetical protein